MRTVLLISAIFAAVALVAIVAWLHFRRTGGAPSRDPVLAPPPPDNAMAGTKISALFSEATMAGGHYYPA